ncbi:nucleotide disphospho-sugar-binding domain-containing protein [Plantactinospora soyae]|uniref:UDP:flavonoid glycosyltransferase YjiC (YdhE family) n=1 Tax=Plantactinospora soyae TaxID=1544732 RepID=A0A927M506_9ACTN|nr:nucleotide disphospho-sugar-binding domain-containing protein [Plantactinospora soyae]MBE1484585.1 UDP:flavonoid glycosyltransferase YjiC (YdhE family) [Plantactinospora soyae]
MRVLFASAPLLGHVFPMVPLAEALRAAGHEVLLATGGDGLDVRRTGLPVADVAPALRFDRIARRVMLRHPLIARAELAGRAGTRGVALLFGAANDQLTHGVVTLADRWQPDLVVYEPLAVAGALAAARRAVPAVLHENSLFDGAELVRVTAARLVRAQHRSGIGDLRPNAATLTIAPPSVVGERIGDPMRAVPLRGVGELPDWLREPGDRPRILVSRSTVTGPGGGDVMTAVVRAAAGVDAEFVLVRPDRRVLRRGALPDNVRTVGWIPINAALPNCAGVVHHGGAGTVLGALAAGVPQLALPGPGDRRHNAALVAARGAGLAVAERDITPAVLDRLVTDRALAVAADEVRREMAAMPDPADLVPRLEALVR